MKIENQVCTLEQAKRLNQLGIVQGLSLFFWDDYEGKQQMMMNATPEDGYAADSENSCFSAFTVAELGIMIGTDEWSTNYNLSGVYYWHAELFKMPYGAYETEAKARAAILIHFLENNNITADKVNQRLLNS